ncbi:MAG TPA: alpha/beta hydrolase, partial [Pararobbsia sp.]|nr:alpha/beta hydrolase [Pararobbsia sp.]
DDATGPLPLSSFDVLDTVLEALADAADYPDLEQVVIAGHSGGAQVVQRYAAVSHGDRALAARGVRTRYVVANPSTYLYFDAQRPTLDGHFAPLDTHTEAGAQANAWKYGLDNLPAYVERQHGACGTGDIEREYVGRDVVVLLGERDCDPRHPALDRSPGALAQGEHRLARGLAYSRYILARHPGNTRHRTLTIPGIGHDPKGIFGSQPGLKALFDFEERPCAKTAQG